MSEVRIIRDPLVESRHEIAYCVWRGGGVVRGSGDLDAPVFYRSAAKPFQALTVVESGAPDRFGFTEEELAMVVGSHVGSPRHARNARSMLEKAGASPDLLRCGGHRPLDRKVYEGYVSRGESWGRLEDNCSGKHSGMIAAAIALGADPATYADPDHPVQRANREHVAAHTGCDALVAGTDGCAVPCFAAPLAAMARGIASFTSSAAPAAQRICDAVARHPEMIGGERRFDTTVIRATDGRVFSKIGAEGVVTIGVRGEDTGIAIKVADGSERALNAFAAALLVDLDLVPAAALAHWHPRTVDTREGDPIGRVEVEL